MLERCSLKSIKTFRGTDGHGLNAWLCLDGKKIAFCIDEAAGGEMEFEIADKKAFDELQAWCEKQPARICKDFGTPFEIKYDIEMVVNDLYEDITRARALRQMQKKTEKAIVIKKTNGDHYWYPLKKRLSEYPKEALKHLVENRIKPKMGPGEKIINDNLSL